MSDVQDTKETARLRFVIPVAPVAKARPRVVLRSGLTHAFTPAKTVQAEAALGLAIAQAIGRGWKPLVGPLAMDVTVFLRLPMRIPQKRWATALPITRPDVDNYAKLVLDAAAILWRDDAQVVDLTVRKRYAERSTPRWEITVVELSRTSEVSHHRTVRSTVE